MVYSHNSFSNKTVFILEHYKSKILASETTPFSKLILRDLASSSSLALKT